MKAAQIFFEGHTWFVTDWGQKTSLTKLVLKCSVLKQSLPNSQFKLLGRSQYESYIEAAQNFFMYVQFSIGIGHKKLPSLNWFLNAQFWSNLYQILSLSFLGEVSMKAKDCSSSNLLLYLLRNLLEQSLYWGSSKFFHVRTIFDRDWAQKTSLTKLVLKHSVLKQSLPNSQFKLLVKSQYESNIEAAQKIFMYVQFSIGMGTKNFPH